MLLSRGSQGQSKADQLAGNALCFLMWVDLRHEGSERGGASSALGQSSTPRCGGGICNRFLKTTKRSLKGEG